MSCYHPLHAFPVGFWPSGKVKYKITDFDVQAVCSKKGSQVWTVCEPDFNVYGYDVCKDPIMIPCGQCIGCRLSYSREWANRMLMELPYHSSAYFLTLTYDSSCVPYSYYYDPYSNVCYPTMTLDPRDLELFWKRLRREYANCQIRYFAAGEYGEESWRPHYHAIVFGLDLDDLRPRAVVRGNTYYESERLQKVWNRGYCLIGEVTWQSCAYVARYCTKKAKGYNAELYKDFGLVPEFCRMSKRPGLGKWFFDDHPDLYDHLSINISTPSGGRKFRPPRYFDKLLEREDPERLDQVKQLRREVADAVMDQILTKTDLDLQEYLQVQEDLADNRLRMLLRSDC